MNHEEQNDPRSASAVWKAWLHGGIRSAQYRENLDRQIDSDFVPWETSLKAIRPVGILGSHWCISTKDLFAASHLCILAAAVVAGEGTPLCHAGFQILLVIAMIITAVFVLILRHPVLPGFDPKAPALKNR